MKELEKLKKLKFIKYKRIHIGRRTIKSALAAVIAMLIVSSYGVSTSKMLFAMLGAMTAMESSFRKSIESCLTQVVGMICGVLAGVLLLYVPIPMLLRVGVGIVFIITLYNVLQIHFSPMLPCMMIVTICTTPDIMPFTYALGRLWDTTIGLLVGMLINIIVLPYDNSLKIRHSIEYLEEEILEFLEDLFDGDTHYPNTKKMTKTMEDMAEQLGIYSQQWLPFTVKRDHERLVILKACQKKAGQLLAHMDVLYGMGKPGVLNEENKKALKEAGAKIGDKRVLDEEDKKEIDVLTNYHVGKIIELRKELIETLEKFPRKGK